MNKTTSTLILLLAAFWAQMAAQAPVLRPETVLVKFHAKAEAELQRVIERHWSAARRMNLVEAEPHLTVRGPEGRAAYFVHVFTWRDASIPDAAPTEIRKIWAEMNRLVEARDGEPGLNFDEVFSSR